MTPPGWLPDVVFFSPVIVLALTRDVARRMAERLYPTAAGIGDRPTMVLPGSAVRCGCG